MRFIAWTVALGTIGLVVTLGALNRVTQAEVKSQTVAQSSVCSTKTTFHSITFCLPQ